MKTSYRLDSERLLEIEPFEGDERSKDWLSGYAIPEAMEGELADSGHLAAIRFDYTGGEAVGGEEPLDERSDPCVWVRTSLASFKVVELRFGPAVSVDDLPRIADRLDARSGAFDRAGKRLSYRMTATVLREWGRNMIR